MLIKDAIATQIMTDSVVSLGFKELFFYICESF